MDGAFLFRYADDGSLPLRPGETAAQVLAQRRDLELHEYYQDIESHTFATTFVPVDVATAEAWRIYNRGGALSADEQQRMGTLKAEVERHIREVMTSGASHAVGASHGAFVRLSTRSPKDALENSPALRKRATDLLRERLRRANLDRLTGDSLANAKLVAVQEVTSELLSVRSADEAFELLSMSSRCVSDLVRMLTHRDDLPTWDLHLIVRRFVPLPPESEFRCFVHERALTAISQYFALSYFPQLPAMREALLQRIATFVTARIPEIKLDSYIIDVAVAVPGLAPAAPATDDNDDDGDDDGDREASPAVPPSLAESTAAAVTVAPCSRGANVAAAGDLAQTATYVIELNPFHPTTGSCYIPLPHLLTTSPYHIPLLRRQAPASLTGRETLRCFVRAPSIYVSSSRHNRTSMPICNPSRRCLMMQWPALLGWIPRRGHSPPQRSVRCSDDVCSPRSHSLNLNV